MRAAVIGGGICGMASAHRLARHGVDVVLYESSPTLGGLGESAPFRGKALEKFYHCFLPTDAHLRSLLDHLGLTPEVTWRPTSMGFFYERRLHRLDTPLDLLRFSPLPLGTRLRVGAFALRARRTRGIRLDGVTAKDWLTRGTGRGAFETLWRPLLEAKFGDAYASVPALWMWRTLTREKSVEGEVKGWLSGGLERLTATLASDIRRRGAEIRTASPVTSIELAGGGVRVRSRESDDDFDFAVSTLPLPLLALALRDAELAARVRAWQLPYQGVVCGRFLLSRPLSPHYWIPTVASDVAFQGVVEMTNLVPPENVGAHLVYVMNYVPASSRLFGRSDEEIAQDYLRGLRALFPDLRRQHVLEQRIFRAPYVEPVYPLRYLRKMPPLELVRGRLGLATTAHVYPDTTSWNSSIGVAERAVDAMLATATPLQRQSRGASETPVRAA